MLYTKYSQLFFTFQIIPNERLDVGNKKMLNLMEN